MASIDRADETDDHGAEQHRIRRVAWSCRVCGAGLDDRADVLLQLPQVVQHGGQRRPPGLRVDLQVPAVAGAQRDLLEVGGDLRAGRCRRRSPLAPRWVPVAYRSKVASAASFGRAHRDELEELAAREPARGEHAVEERAFLRGALLGVAERLQGGDAPAQRGVAGAVQAVVDAAQLGDPAGVEGEGGGPVGGARVGAGPYPGQTVQLRRPPGGPGPAPRRRRATRSSTSARWSSTRLRAGASSARKPTLPPSRPAVEATLGLQLLHEVLHRQGEGDGAGGPVAVR